MVEVKRMGLPGEKGDPDKCDFFAVKLVHLNADGTPKAVLWLDNDGKPVRKVEEAIKFKKKDEVDNYVRQLTDAIVSSIKTCEEKGDWAPKAIILIVEGFIKKDGQPPERTVVLH